MSKYLMKYAARVTVDPIQEMTDAWREELPDLDVAPMATLAQVNRLALLVNRRVEEALSGEGRTLADFDVLSALRRQGPPYRLKPSELSRQVMLSASGMTHRVDLLEAAGLVERQLDPDNRRITPVALTDEGVQAAEALVRLVVAVEAGVLDCVTPSQQSSLDRLTGRIVSHVAGAPRKK